MQTSTQPLAHRQITRTKPRWQPYASTANHQHPASPSTGAIHTAQPSSEYSDKLDREHHRSTHSVPPPNTATYTPSTSKESARDPSKTKFAASLVDQTVKLLSEVWAPEIIPSSFRPPLATAVTNDSNNGASDLLTKLQETHSTPSVTSQTPEQPLLPIRPFVHEILRRSRTSGSVLQTALCYLEAVRHKIPDIAREGNGASRLYFQPESRIMPATAAELAREAEFARLEQELEEDICSEYVGFDPEDMTSNTLASPASEPDRLANNFVQSHPTHEIIKTIKVVDEHHLDTSSDADESSLSTSRSSSGTATLLSTPPTSHPKDSSHASPPPDHSTPSPLLCPRRAFLAALVLATKFSQDKCYSNRAWAKLSGLSARQIGRCERALGQMLDWRLWAGKKTSPATGTTTPTRPVLRSQSEGSILTTPALREQFLPSPTPAPLTPLTPAGDAIVDRKSHPGSLLNRQRQPLGRSSTLPAHLFNSGAGVENGTDSLAMRDFRIVNQHGGGILEDGTDSQLFALTPENCSSGAHNDILSIYSVSDVPYQAGLVKLISVKDTSHSSASSDTPSAAMDVDLSSSSSSSLKSFASESPETPSPPSLTFSPSATDISSGAQTVSIDSVDETLLTSYNPSQPWTNLADKGFLHNGLRSGNGAGRLEDNVPIKAAWHNMAPTWNLSEPSYHAYDAVNVY